MSVLRVIGIVLLVIGVVVLVWGAYNLISYNSSTAGKVAAKLTGITGKQPKAVQDSIIKIIIGVGCTGAGFFLFRKA
jgi:hypothetical protein